MVFAHLFLCMTTNLCCPYLFPNASWAGRKECLNKSPEIAYDIFSWNFYCPNSMNNPKAYILEWGCIQWLGLSGAPYLIRSWLIALWEEPQVWAWKGSRWQSVLWVWELYSSMILWLVMLLFLCWAFSAVNCCVVLLCMGNSCYTSFWRACLSIINYVIAIWTVVKMPWGYNIYKNAR